MSSMHDILRAAESLPAEERAKIVDSLLRSLNPADSAAEQKWLNEAKRRLEEIRSGRVPTVPGNEVFARIRDRFGS